MNQTGSPRETIVNKINEIVDYPFFALEAEEINWVIKDWIESHTKHRTEEILMEIDKNTGIPYVTIAMSEELVPQAT